MKCTYLCHVPAWGSKSGLDPAADRYQNRSEKQLGSTMTISTSRADTSVPGEHQHSRDTTDRVVSSFAKKQSRRYTQTS